MSRSELNFSLYDNYAFCTKLSSFNYSVGMIMSSEYIELSGRSQMLNGLLNVLPDAGIYTVFVV